FFALGRAKLLGKPAAVVTTSGTAVAELLPAVVEAFYSGTPLIVITADRPARYRGTGAPQCIEQEGIFGPYAGGCVVHVNGEFDGVIRIGNVPTLRFWRDLDEKFKVLDVVNISALPFPGLSRGDVRPMSALDDDVESRPAPRAFFDDDRDKTRRIDAILYGE